MIELILIAQINSVPNRDVVVPMQPRVPEFKAPEFKAPEMKAPEIKQPSVSDYQRDRVSPINQPSVTDYLEYQRNRDGGNHGSR